MSADPLQRPGIGDVLLRSQSTGAALMEDFMAAQTLPETDLTVSVGFCPETSQIDVLHEWQLESPVLVPDQTSTSVAERAVLDNLLQENASIRSVLNARLVALRSVRALWPVAAAGCSSTVHSVQNSPMSDVPGSSALAVRRAAAESDCAVLGDMLVAVQRNSSSFVAHLDLDTIAELVLPNALPRLLRTASDYHFGAVLHCLLVLLHHTDSRPMVKVQPPAAAALRPGGAMPVALRSRSALTGKLNQKQRLEYWQAVVVGLREVLSVLKSRNRGSVSGSEGQWESLARICAALISHQLSEQRAATSADFIAGSFHCPLPDCVDSGVLLSRASKEVTNVRGLCNSQNPEICSEIKSGAAFASCPKDQQKQGVQNQAQKTVVQACMSQPIQPEPPLPSLKAKVSGSCRATPAGRPIVNVGRHDLSSRRKEFVRAAQASK